MTKILTTISFLLLFSCSTTQSTKNNSSSEEEHDPYRIARTIPEEYQMPVALSEMFGTEIYFQDIAAWVVTDFLAEKGVLQKDKRLKGWIVEKDSEKDELTDKMQVTFIGEVNGKLKGLHQVKSKFNKVLEESYVNPENGFDLTENQKSLFVARQTALKSEFMRCSERYNTVAFKFEMVDEDVIQNHTIVYLLAATTEANKIMAGGNYKFTLNESGDKILESKALSKSCIILQKAEGVVGLTLSHIVEPTPNAVHVYLSLMHDVPLYVMTTENKMLWKVDGNTISIVK